MELTIPSRLICSLPKFSQQRYVEISIENAKTDKQATIVILDLSILEIRYHVHKSAFFI